MSGILSREEALAFDRWQLPVVGEPDPDLLPEPEPEPAPGPTLFELEEIERAAREEGYNAGLAEGRAAAKVELDERLARLDALCMAAARPLQAFDDTTEKEIALLATVIARRVIERELRQDPTLIETAVHQAIAALPSATRELRIWLHPQDLDLLRTLEASEPAWRFGANPSLQRGDCVIESERSRLDARVSTRLDAVVQAVLGEDLDDDDATDEVAG